MKYFLKTGCLQDQFLPKQFGLPEIHQGFPNNSGGIISVSF